MRCAGHGAARTDRPTKFSAAAHNLWPCPGGRRKSTFKPAKEAVLRDLRRVKIGFSRDETLRSVRRRERVVRHFAPSRASAPLGAAWIFETPNEQQGIPQIRTLADAPCRLCLFRHELHGLDSAWPVGGSDRRRSSSRRLAKRLDGRAAGARRRFAARR